MANFFNNLKKKANSFISSAPGYYQKARAFANTAVKHGQKGAKFITNVNNAVQDSPLFNEKLKETSRRIDSTATKGVRRLDEINKQGQDFLDKVQGGSLE